MKTADWHALMFSAVGVKLALFYQNGVEVLDLMHMDDSYLCNNWQLCSSLGCGFTVMQFFIFYFSPP